MAKQIEGVYENIIACATKEFLNKGYVDASLRTIATEAHTQQQVQSIPDLATKRDFLRQL